MRKYLLQGCALTFLMTGVARGQVTTGTISGSVTDSTGAVLPAASVVILNEETGLSRSLNTDAGGRYLAPSLSLGRYRITISQPGFQTEVRTGIILTIGRNAVVDTQLQIGAVSQTVEVTGEAPLVETRESAVAYLVNSTTISELPLNGRDITQLIFLQPGVSVAANSASGNAYVGFANKFSIGGMRGEDNAYLLDGSYLNNMNRQLPSGPSGALLGSETVKEFNVLTNNYSAQFGRALGGVFNAVSKSGSNQWNGDVYEYFRDNALDARKFFDLKKSPDDPRNPEFRRNSFGGTFGGPLQRDKAFFFLAYEALRESKTTTEYRTVPDENARRGIGLKGANGTTLAPFTVSPLTGRFLQLFPLPSPQGQNFGDGTAEFIFLGENTAQDDYGQARIDYQLTDNDSLFGRFTGSNAHKDVPESYPDYHTLQVMNTRLATLSETRILSPAMLNTVRFHFNRIDPQDVGSYPSVDASLTSSSTTTIPAAISPGTGVTPNEGAPKPIDRWVTNRYNFQEEMSWTLGGHALQFGGMIERMQFNMITPNRPYTTWTWDNLADFLQYGSPGTTVCIVSGCAPSSYRGTPNGIPVVINGAVQQSDSSRGFRQWFYALYLQDNWQITSRLTLNLGLRWEPYTVPTEVNGKIANLRHASDTAEFIGEPYWINHSKKDFGPRFGFAWSPFGSGTSVRGGIGLFYVPNDPQVYRSQANRNAFFPEYQFNNPQGFPNALAAIAAAPASMAPEAVMYVGQRSPHAMQYNFSIQQQIGQSSVVSAGYTGARGLDATAYVEINQPKLIFDGVSLGFPVGATLPNTTYSAIKYYMNATDSWYHGFISSFQHRFSRGLQAQVSYTFSKALSTADTTSKTDSSGGGASPKYAYDMEVNKGYSGYHLANVLTMNYVYDLPFGQASTGITGGLLSGWQLSGIVKLQSGQPFSVTGGGSLPSAFRSLNVARGPVLDSSFTRDEIIQGHPDHPNDKAWYFNPRAFLVSPNPLSVGNVTKSFLIGPGFATWDFSITKNLSLSEDKRLQFRGEFFNILNRANLGKPSSSIFSGTATPSPSAGRITTTVTEGRQIQLGVKLSF